MQATLDLIRTRISANKFDTKKTLSKDQTRELVEYATQAPASTNIQHWRFVAVTKPEDKERLKHVAFGQQKVADAAVTCIVLGDVRGHEKLGDILDRSVAAGVVPQELRDKWVDMVNTGCADPQRSPRRGDSFCLARRHDAHDRGAGQGLCLGTDDRLQP